MISNRASGFASAALGDSYSGLSRRVYVSSIEDAHSLVHGTTCTPSRTEALLPP